MILIVGAAASGRHAFARSLGYEEKDFSAGIHDDCPVLDRLEDSVDIHSGEDLLPLLLKKDVVIVREVGSGIIPADHEERLWREAVGRLSCRLAAEAETVVRTVCGIPAVIKGEIK